MVKKNNNWYEKFAQAFHEVVLPLFEEIREKITSIEHRLDSIERKLDAHQDRTDRHGIQLKDHEGKIQTLETRASS